MIFTGVSLLLNFLGGNETISASNKINVFNSDFGESSVSKVNIELKVNPYRQKVLLDSVGNFSLEWEVNWKKEMVYFNVSAATKGYIGFGLSRKGKMSGADIVIGGVDKNGKPYLSDRHAIGNQLPVLDQSQDWILHEAWEKEGLTFLGFSRPFDTCDSEGDLRIDENSLVSVIWAYGEVDDELQYHFENRGVYNLYLLDPNLAPESLVDTFKEGKIPLKPSKLNNTTGSTNLFRIQQQKNISQQDTLYWCSFHRMPTSKKHHIIGYNVVFPTERDRRHVHHLLLHRCQVPPSSSATGGPCYLGNSVVPSEFSFCSEQVAAWGVGGRAIFFPEHVGLPISESGPEYFLLQVHYDNPNLLPNLTITVSLDIYYTSKLRQNDGAILMLGAGVPGAANLVIPPSSLSHVINGHCAPGCTQKLFPAEGITVFASVLHTHLTGRGVRLRHFREGKELPWIIADDNYNFNYQQVRLLNDEVKIVPGDHLVQKCVYDSTARNGTVVTGGYSTREEMCLAFLFYYTRVPGAFNCLSQIEEESYIDLLGIWNTTFDLKTKEALVTDPRQFSGLTVSNYLTNYIGEWTLRFRKEVQRQHLLQAQISTCPTFSTVSSAQDSISNGGEPLYDLVKVGPEELPGKKDLPTKLSYVFKRKNNTLNDSPGSKQKTQNIVIHQEEAVIPRRIRVFKPYSKCGVGNRGKQRGVRRFPSYRDADRIKNEVNNQFKFNNFWVE
ncbi:unnamed protein product [Orchesella dallaii]|uniref:DOMON domain-containing protein n=1 Tax=Orchesella dallaii TaxID=48710 RepID=A0ABP1PHP9_9HEXA